MTLAILCAGPIAGLMSAFLYWRLINAIGNALAELDAAILKVECNDA
jgi:ABC-type Mn2+/Zn2+ transport system permease subunit